MTSTSNGFPGRRGRDPGTAAEPAPRWRIALRRLPLTLGVLLIVGSGAAGLAYVASGSGGHGVAATFYNDLGRSLEVGSCADAGCKSGGSLDVERVAPRQSILEKLRVGSTVNPFLVTMQGGARVGCLFLRFRRTPASTPFVRLSRVVRC